MRWWVALAVIAAAMLVGGCGDEETKGTTSGSAQGNGAALPVISFATANGQRVPLTVEVADDGAEMGCGLMHRTQLGDDRGMIFLYREDSAGGFWMRNTLIPLSIAYTAADGRIVDIIDMRPVPAAGHTPYRLPDGRTVAIADGQPVPAGAVWETYPPRAPFRYAIEANQGWFARHGIAAGDTVDVSASLAAADAAAPPPICTERGI